MQFVVFVRWSPRWLFAQNERLSWSSRRHENVTQVAEKGGKSKEKAENKGEISLAQPAEI